MSGKDRLIEQAREVVREVALGWAGENDRGRIEAAADHFVQVRLEPLSEEEIRIRLQTSQRVLQEFAEFLRDTHPTLSCMPLPGSEDEQICRPES